MVRNSPCISWTWGASITPTEAKEQQMLLEHAL